MSDEINPTPGNGVFHFQVNGKSFTYRWPTQADIDRISRIQAANMTVNAGFTEGEARIASETLGLLNGNGIEWEARLQVGLLPRQRRDGSVLSLGEGAPESWKQTRKFAGQDVTEISFDDVDPDEFNEVCQVIREADEERRKKKAGPPVPSTPTAPLATSA